MAGCHGLLALSSAAAGEDDDPWRAGAEAGQRIEPGVLLLADGSIHSDLWVTDF